MNNAANPLFVKYKSAIESAKLQSVSCSSELPPELCMGTDGNLSIYYSPFDYTNRDAKVVIVGITPGFTQAMKALREAQQQMAAGADDITVLKRAKLTGAFSGPLRNNLVALLDHIRLHELLGISSCADLFGPAAHLVHTTSALRFPVFRAGVNYNGNPDMSENPFLRQQLHDHFGKEARLLADTIFIPLGSRVSSALRSLAADGAIDEIMILARTSKWEKGRFEGRVEGIGIDA